MSEMKMKKVFFTIMVVFLAGVVIYGFPVKTDAVATGACSSCHTMHSSQGGTDTGIAYGGSTLPQPALTRGSCVGCHSDTGASTIKLIGGSNVPIVWNIAGGTLDPGTSNSWPVTANMNLAGGNFYYVVTGPTHPKGHNVEGVVAIDIPLGNAPPGYALAHDPSTVKYSTGSRLTCAGSNGCHGNRNVTGSFAGIKGAHHGIGTPIDGSTTAKSYRFLGSAALATHSVKGLEDSNWQQSASVAALASDHNEYKGALSQTVTDTISYLCGHCHGNFHTGIGTASPWLRHPTDTDVRGKLGEYANYGLREAAGGTVAGTYILQAPVGYVTTPTSPRATVASGDSPVTCLSCHRAHASNFADILRWDYATMQAGGGSVTENYGCFTCHTTKDD